MVLWTAIDVQFQDLGQDLLIDLGLQNGEIPVQPFPASTIWLLVL